MRDAVIVDAVRTPIGKRHGSLSSIHPVDLSALALQALIERVGVDPGLIDDVIWGCVSQTGEQSSNVGRCAVLAAGWPTDITGTTIDRACGSSQQAAHFAAAGVIAGQYDVVIAGGVESMSRVPIGSGRERGPGLPYGPMMRARYDDALVGQGISAERIAKKWNLTRAELDRLALNSHERAAAATDEGYFRDGIVPVKVTDDSGSTFLFSEDEGVRRNTSMEALAALRPAFADDGLITAGNSSQISDGAAALLITSSQVAARLGVKPIARFHSFALAGADPILMLTAPIPATRKLLDRSGLRLDDVGVFEVNEAFASVVYAWQREIGAPWAKVNPHGGAIALGHPLGGSGAALLTKMVHHMRDANIRFGLQTMCEGGGMANATMLELVT
jgi:acetyl-CoA acyltransferase